MTNEDNNKDESISNDFLINFLDAKFDKIDEKFNNQNEKFDRIDEEFKELREDNKDLRADIKNIKENHLTHIYDKIDEQNKMFREKLEEQNKFIHKLEGSFDVVKSLLVVIAGGVVVAVFKYLFFT